MNEDYIVTKDVEIELDYRVFKQILQKYGKEITEASINFAKISLRWMLSFGYRSYKIDGLVFDAPDNQKFNLTYEFDTEDDTEEQTIEVTINWFQLSEDSFTISSSSDIFPDHIDLSYNSDKLVGTVYF